MSLLYHIVCYNFYHAKETGVMGGKGRETSIKNAWKWRVGAAGADNREALS